MDAKFLPYQRCVAPFEVERYQVGVVRDPKSTVIAWGEQSDYLNGHKRQREGCALIGISCQAAIIFAHPIAEEDDVWLSSILEAKEDTSASLRDQLTITGVDTSAREFGQTPVSSSVESTTPVG